MNKYQLAVTNLIMLAVTLAFNFLTGTGLINGLSQAEISAMYQTKITPAGFAFSIWGVIYTLVTISLGWMFYKRKDRKTKQVIDAIGYWFIIASLANVLWTVTFAYLQLPLSTVLIFILLFSLTRIVMNLSKVRINLSPLYTVTFGLYTGWVLIASVVNIAASLVQAEWNGFGISELVWATIIIVVAVAIVFYVTYRTTNAIIPLPVAWAYYAIFVGEELTVALLGMVVLLAYCLLSILSKPFGLSKNISLRRSHSAMGGFFIYGKF